MLFRSSARRPRCGPGPSPRQIVVYTGILPVTKTEAGLAVVMGHEVAHALADHGAQHMSASTLQQIGAIAGSIALQSSKYAAYTDQFMLAYGLGIYNYREFYTLFFYAVKKSSKIIE